MSISRVASLRPEIEFEIIKLVLLREKNILKLTHLLRTRKSNGSRILDTSVIGKIDVLREITIEVFKTIYEWEQSQLNFPEIVKPFPWNGQDYLEKMLNDISFLNDYPELKEWLEFSFLENPFIVPSEIFDDNFSMGKKSYLIFGKKPYIPLHVESDSMSLKRLIKSPYVTPIVNDPDIIPSVSADHKMKKIAKESRLTEERIRKYDKMRDKILKDPYETYLSEPVVRSIRTYFLALQRRIISKSNSSSNMSMPALNLESQLSSFNLNTTDLAKNTNYGSNSYMRKTTLKFIEDEGDTNTNAHIWTPHELKLQKVVQKKGGELSLMTAAGTKGRIKAPSRKSRFERLEIDVNRTQEQYEMLSMNVEDIFGQTSFKLTDQEYKIKCDVRDKLKLHLDFLATQKKHYELISSGVSTDRIKLDKICRLLEGQALDADENTSTTLEYKMAARIQKLVRRKLARTMRRKLIVSYNKAATKIQALWRKYFASRVITSHSLKVQLAIIIQKLYRGRKARDFLRNLRLESRRLNAVKAIQRIFRGHHGRRRFMLKQEFLTNVKEANKVISSYELIPSHLDALADEIENFLSDFTVILSLNVLVIIRGILYMLNGESTPENVFIFSNGNLRTTSIFASNLSWNGAVLIIRRKGRLIRRLRALAKSVSNPNPVVLRFSDDCIKHLTAVENISSGISGCGTIFGIKSVLGKECLLKLCQFCRYMLRIHELQSFFSDYFVCSHENWFRAMLKHQLVIQGYIVQNHYQNVCKLELEEKRQKCLKEGKKLGPVLNALKVIKDDIIKTSKLKSVSETKFMKFVADLEVDEDRKLAVYQNLEGSKKLSVELSKKELIESKMLNFRNNLQSGNTSNIKDLQSALDRNSLALLECQNEIITLQADIKRRKELRNVQNFISMKKVLKISFEYGSLLSEILILQQIWRSLIHEIGGVQYGKDLVGEKLLYFENLKDAISNAMALRSKHLASIQSCLEAEFSNFDSFVLATRARLLSQHWDQPTFLAYESEENENKEIARIYANKKYQLSHYTLGSSEVNHVLDVPLSKSFKPVLLLIDSSLPEITKTAIISKYSELQFQLCSYKIFDTTLVIKIQEIFSRFQNVILLVDRGVDALSHKQFMGIYKNILHGLSIKPRVVHVRHQFRIEPWYSRYSVNIASILESFETSTLRFNIESTTESKLLLGKLRQKALLYSDLLSKSSESAISITFSLKSYFLNDFNKLLEEAEGLVSDFDFKSNSFISQKRRESLAPLNENPLATLIASVTCLFGLWNAPTISWSSRHVHVGLKAFLNLSLDELCDHLFFNSLPICSTNQLNICRLITRMKNIWNEYLCKDLNTQPSRYLLAHWCISAIKLIESVANRGGFADNDDIEFSKTIDATCNITWRDNGLYESKVNSLLGDLFNLCFEPTKIIDESIKISSFQNQFEKNDIHQRVTLQSFTTNRVCIYENFSDLYIGVHYTAKLDNNSSFLVSHISFEQLRHTSYPTVVEMAEGRITSYSDIILNSQRKMNPWIDAILGWVNVNNIQDKSRLTIRRNLYLLLSKVGVINGHNVRLEIFEDRYGELLFVMYGVNNLKGIEYYLTAKKIASIAAKTINREEKSHLESYDSFGMALYCGDRVEIKPSKPWLTFVSTEELIYSKLFECTSININENRGSGRYMGCTVTKIFEIPLLVSAYELTNDFDVYGLRVIVYDSYTSKSVEFQFSPLERAVYFDSSNNLFDQIISRLQLLYCNTSCQAHITLPLADGDSIASRLLASRGYEVYGESEFDIVLPNKYCASTVSAQNAIVHQSYLDSNIEESNIQSEREDLERNLVEVLEGNTFKVASSQINTNEFADSDVCTWNWSIRFNRATEVEYFGNLVISVCFNHSLKGFIVNVLDLRTFHELSKFLNFENVSNVISMDTSNKLTKLTVALNEDLLQEIIEELLAALEITNTADEKYWTISLKCHSCDCNSIFIANLKYRESDLSDKITRKPLLQRNVLIKIYEAKGLNVHENVVDTMTEQPNNEEITEDIHPKPLFQSLVECRLKFNGQYIGTIYQNKSAGSDIKFSSSSSHATSPEVCTIMSIHKSFRQSKLEIELFEDFKTENNSETFYLGKATLEGKKLELFFLNGDINSVLVDINDENIGNSFQRQHGRVRVQGKYFRNDEPEQSFIPNIATDSEIYLKSNPSKPKQYDTALTSLDTMNIVENANLTLEPLSPLSHEASEKQSEIITPHKSDYSPLKLGSPKSELLNTPTRIGDQVLQSPGKNVLSSNSEALNKAALEASNSSKSSRSFRFSMKLTNEKPLLDIETSGKAFEFSPKRLTSFSGPLTLSSKKSRGSRASYKIATLEEENENENSTRAKSPVSAFFRNVSSRFRLTDKPSGEIFSKNIFSGKSNLNESNIVSKSGFASPIAAQFSKTHHQLVKVPQSFEFQGDDDLDSYVSLDDYDNNESNELEEPYYFDDGFDKKGISNNNYVERRLDLYLMKGKSFPLIKDFDVMTALVVIVKWDGYEVSRSECLSNIIDDSGEADFGNEYVSIPIRVKEFVNPYGTSKTFVSLNENFLEIEIWSYDTANEKLNVLLATIDIRGEQLNSFASGNGYASSWLKVKFQKHSFQKDRHILNHHPENEFEDNHLHDQSDNVSEANNSGKKSIGLSSMHRLTSMVKRGQSGIESRAAPNSTFNTGKKMPSLVFPMKQHSFIGSLFKMPSMHTQLSNTGRSNGSFLMNFSRHSPKSGQSKHHFLSYGVSAMSAASNKSDENKNLDLLDNNIITTSFENVFGNLQAKNNAPVVFQDQNSEIEVQAVLTESYSNPICQEIELNSFALKNMCFYNKEGVEVMSVDGIVTIVVVFNKKVVKVMKSKSPTEDRTWPFTDRFKMSLYGKRKILDCVLDLRVYEGDLVKLHPSKRSLKKPLGIKTLTGVELLKVLTTKSTKDQKKPTSKLIKAMLVASGSKGIASSFELHPVHSNDSQLTATFHGLIELQGKFVKEEEAESVIANDPTSDWITSRGLIHKLKTAETFLSSHLLPLDIDDSIVREVNNLSVEVVNVQVLAIKGLSGGKMDKFLSASSVRTGYFAKLFLNGQFINSTKSVSPSGAIVDWHDKEIFDLLIPRGHLIDACRLAINIYQEVEGVPSFYGKCILENSDFVSLITKFSKDQELDYKDLPLCECRIYDIKGRELQSSIELRAWMRCIDDDHHQEIRLQRNPVMSIQRKLLLQQRLKFDLTITGIRNIGLPAFEGNSAPNSPSAINTQWISQPTPPDSPTFEFAKAAGKSKTFLIELRWNKQRVFLLQGLSHPKKLTLFTPPGCALNQCRLNILIWVHGKCVGEVHLSGEKLDGLISSTSVNVNSNGKWYFLTSSDLIPLSAKSEDDIQGMMCLKGQAVEMLPQNKVNEPSDTTRVASNRRRKQNTTIDLHTTLRTMTLGWRHIEDSEVSLSSVSKGQLIKNEPEDSRNEFCNDSSSGHNDSNMTIDQWKSSHVIVHSKAIEHPAFEKGVEQSLHDNGRVCWRGILQPKEFIFEADDQSVFMPLSKRLIHALPLRSVKVEAEISYLNDPSGIDDSFNQKKDTNQKKLPITVREIPSQGPGLIQRHYRFDISTSTGSQIGVVDMRDSYEDFLDIVGSRNKDLIDRPQQSWDLDQIFSHIIQNRLVIHTTQVQHGDDNSTVASLNSKFTKKSNHANRKFNLILLRDSTSNSNKIHDSHLNLNSLASPRCSLSSMLNPKMSYPSCAGDNIRNYSSAKLMVTKRREQSVVTHEIIKVMPQLAASYLGNTQPYSGHQWIRICSKVWRMSGKKFSVVVLFMCDDSVLVSDPDLYFSRFSSGTDGLSSVKVLFRCKDSKTERVYDLLLEGHKLSYCIDKKYPLNLGTHYRREKFGFFIVTYLLMRYEEDAVSCKISFNFDALHKGTKYLVFMKDENIITADNAIKKPKFISQKSNVENSNENFNQRPESREMDRSIGDLFERPDEMPEPIENPLSNKSEARLLGRNIHLAPVNTDISE